MMSHWELGGIHALRGPNIWARVPVLEVSLRGANSAVPPASLERIEDWLASAPRPGDSAGRFHAFCEQRRASVTLADVLAQLTLTLQTLAGPPVSFAQVEPEPEASGYRLLIEFDEEELARQCLDVASGLCRAALQDALFPIAGEVRRLREVADRVCLGPSTRAIVQAARRRGIPTRRLTGGSLVQLGHGIQQRRYCAGETDRTGAIAETIAGDKELTKRLLRAAGVPVPEGRLVSDAQDAWQAAQDLHGPAVVKPLNGNHGRGVFIGLTNREEVLFAYQRAVDEGEGVIVERSVSGAEHRLLVVGDQLIAAMRGDPIYVVGDGLHTVLELVAELNRDPRRGEDSEVPLMPVDFDSPNLASLQQQGYTTDSIPAAGVRVLVQRNGNLAADVTDQVHPENADAVVRAAHTVGLDIAGVDIVADDISRPLRLQGGAVVEVNAGPGLQMHLQPGSGTPRPVGEAIVALLFPGPATGRIPIVAVSGGGPRTTIAQMLQRVLVSASRCSGLASAAGVSMAGEQLRAGDATGVRHVDDLLLHPQLEAAVLDIPPARVISEGLGFDLCQVAVITAVDAASPATPEGSWRAGKTTAAERTVVETIAADGAAVLDARLPALAELCACAQGEVILWAQAASHPAVVAHRGRGGKAVFVRDGYVVLAQGQREEQQAAVPREPSAGDRLDNAAVLPCVAAAWALGLPTSSLEAGLQAC
jgi:cyanophycin synthetase